METAKLTRKLKIFCPTHQSVFEVEENPQIACEIKEHSLSNDFPRSEFWEYCCDCQTFTPSKFGTGGKAKNVCPHCERTTVRRFVCNECKIVAYDSDEETKGKIYEIDAAQGIKPDCPGCRKIYVGTKVLGHLCRDIDGMILTALAECPFCLKPTLDQAKPKKVESIPTVAETAKLDSQAVTSQCPKCGHWGRVDRAICGKCGVQINALGTGVAAGTATPKTQLLGSICPNCGAGNDADSMFCANCGQALKTVPQTADEPETVTVVNPKFPPSMPPIPVAPPNFSPVAEQSAAPQKMSSESKTALFLILGVFGFLVVLGLIAVNSNKPTTTVNNAANSSNNGKISNNTARINSPTIYKPNNSAIDNRATSNSSSPLIGRIGRLDRNLNIRSSAGQYAENIGTHYRGARVKILDSESVYNDSSERVIWYRVEVLENGCDQQTGSCGNNWERYGNVGWMEAEMEGWMNSKHISLE